MLIVVLEITSDFHQNWIDLLFQDCPSGAFIIFHSVFVVCGTKYLFLQLQLIDKEPSKAVSLFWAAINAGDRVDSALKDMSIVMKQLDRSEEAIEAIKSFRHLCPYESQDSLDNVLVELYKVKNHSQIKSYLYFTYIVFVIFFENTKCGVSCLPPLSDFLRSNVVAFDSLAKENFPFLFS